MNALLEGTMDQRIERMLQEQQQEHHSAIDRMFGVLMLIQWAATVAAAQWVSPLTWSGLSYETHPHIWLAIGLGGAIASLPVTLDICFPGRTLTRHVNGIAQVLFSGLLIHVTGGRIETHFHVFGSLAFLACYRDWKILVAPTFIVAADHWLRGLWWPESVYGSASASYWRWLEHAGWVLFEDVFLTIACLQGHAQMRSIAARTVALEDTDRWKKSILEAALDAVVSINGDGEVTEWNSKAETLFGWTAAEAMGRPLDELIIPQSHRAAHVQGLQNYKVTRRGPMLNQRIEITAVRRDGTEFPVEIAITPIHRQQEVSFCGFIRDITTRKRVEQELRSAKEAAEAANQSKSSFLANMSHEIRTPLNGILGFAELLRRGSDRGDAAKRGEFIETIMRSGRHLLTLINDVLDLSKIEAGQLEVKRVSCSPHEMLAEVISILRVTAQEKGLSLQYFWNGDVPETIETDPDRLRQILMNLVGNAIKFTEHGSVSLSAELVRSPLDGPTHLQFTVKDTGMGIRPDKLQAIFDPFVQADSSVTRRFGGTGLGLSISKRLCQLLGGSIEVQSQPGLGSLFTFTIDAGQVQFGQNKRPRSGDVIQTQRPNDAFKPDVLDGYRVLLIEDGDVNRQLIQIMLEEAGAEVTLAENGKQGLAEAVRQPFAAILLDMQMPIMDGYTAAREMRKAGLTCPIIAFTAHAMSGDTEKCLAAGCSHYLSKPVDSERLLRTLTMALQAPSPLPQPIPPATEAMPAAAKSSPAPIRSTLPVEKPVFRQIVRDYVHSLPAVIEELEEACRQEDLERLAQLTHTLKGTGGTAGFPALSSAADKLLRAVRQQNAEDIPEMLIQVKEVVQRVTVASD